MAPVQVLESNNDMRDGQVGGAADAWAALLAEMTPEAQSAALLGQLVEGPGGGFEEFSRQGIADAIKSCERHVAWYQAMQLRLIAALPGASLPSGFVPGREFATTEISTLVRCSEPVAQNKLALAEELTALLPATLGELAAGRIGILHAVAMAEYTRPLDPAQVSAVEAKVLPKALDRTVPQTKEALRRAVHQIDPEGARRRHEQRRADRRVERSADIDGMAWVSALLTAQDAARVSAAVDTRAQQLKAQDSQGRTLDQLRADALVDLVCHHGLAGAPDSTTVNINVTVSRETLMGAAEDGGILEGYGPVTADQARELAYSRAAVWHRLLIDGSGRALSVTPNVYRPGAALRRLVEARDAQCSFPTCRMPARRCDLDHVDAFSSGGRTTEHNLAPACRHHHRAKHEAGWTVTRDPQTGHTVWAAPTGHRYVNFPTDYRP